MEKVMKLSQIWEEEFSEFDKALKKELEKWFVLSYGEDGQLHGHFDACGVHAKIGGEVISPILFRLTWMTFWSEGADDYIAKGQYGDSKGNYISVPFTTPVICFLAEFQKEENGWESGIITTSEMSINSTDASVLGVKVLEFYGNSYTGHYRSISPADYYIVWNELTNTKRFRRVQAFYDAYYNVNFTADLSATTTSNSNCRIFEKIEKLIWCEGVPYKTEGLYLKYNSKYYEIFRAPTLSYLL